MIRFRDKGLGFNGKGLGLSVRFKGLGGTDINTLVENQMERTHAELRFQASGLECKVGWSGFRLQGLGLERGRTIWGLEG